MQVSLKFLLKYKSAAHRIVAVSIFVVIYLLYGKSGPSYIIVWKQTNVTSCHYSNDEDALEAVDLNFSLPLWSIFFIETSCHGGLNSRQACSVESAARAHPLWQITVFFLGPISEYALNQSCLGTLKQFTNVKLVRIRIADFTKGTPLAPMISEKRFENSSFPIESFSNALRYLILYKWGGIYLDTDMIVAKNLSPLGANWVGREDHSKINTAALGIASDAVGTQFAADLLDEFTNHYNAREWGLNGPMLITRILYKKWCNPYEFKNWTSMTCRGISIYNRKLLYPVHYSNRSTLFINSNWDLLKNISSYTIHTWNRLTSNLPIAQNSPYRRLAKQFCPNIYNLFRNKFGA